MESVESFKRNKEIELQITKKLTEEEKLYFNKITNHLDNNIKLSNRLTKDNEKLHKMIEDLNNRIIEHRNIFMNAIHKGDAALFEKVKNRIISQDHTANIIAENKETFD